MQTIELAAVASAVSSFWTANDPFVGKWRLDASRSVIVDQMMVEAVGPNKYRFKFEGSPAETIVADATDQPGLAGTTLSVKADGPRRLSVVRKHDGRTIVSASWNLAQDGSTLRDAFTSTQSDGSELTVDYLYRRVSGGTGFAGTWESTTKPVGLKVELEIEPHDGKGFSFITSESAKKVIFDGRGHVVADADGRPTLSGRRGGMRTMEYAEKNRGKVTRLRDFELSTDGRTLTETVRIARQTNPDVLVFERE